MALEWLVAVKIDGALKSHPEAYYQDYRSLRRLIAVAVGGTCARAGLSIKECKLKFRHAPDGDIIGYTNLGDDSELIKAKLNAFNNSSSSSLVWKRESPPMMDLLAPYRFRIKQEATANA